MRQALEDRQRSGPTPGNLARSVGEKRPPDDSIGVVSRWDSRTPGNRGREQ